MGEIESYEELESAIASVASAHPECLILYRGQRQLYDSVRAGRGRPNYHSAPLVESGWASLADKLLGLEDSRPDLAQSILQHYGYETFFVDLSSDPKVAAWFATNDFSSERNLYIGNQMRLVNVASYEKPANSIGYFMVFAIPDPEALKDRGRLVDLSELDTDFLRPHRQQGWLLLDRPPTRPTPDDFLIATFELALPEFEVEIEAELFPTEDEDRAFAKMREMPYVQFDQYSDEDDENPTACAVRLLNFPEYQFGNNHKWNDVTLYEPLPMREWKIWRANLRDAVDGPDADIKDTTKISISPTAYELLEGADSAPLKWPELGKDGLFFTFCQLDHDKYIDHGPPYQGVWLQRDSDLIFETPMEVVDDSLSVLGGHPFFFKDGVIERQEMPKSCRCDHPETHNKRLEMMLRIQHLVEGRKLILLPHPYFSEDWFYLITGTERDFLAKDIDDAKVTHAYAMKYVAEKIAKGEKFGTKLERRD